MLSIEKRVLLCDQYDPVDAKAFALKPFYMTKIHHLFLRHLQALQMKGTVAQPNPGLALIFLLGHAAFLTY